MADPSSSSDQPSHGPPPGGRPPVDPSGSATPPPPPPAYAPAPAGEAGGRRRGLLSRMLGSAVLGLLVLSILLNLYMGVLVYRMTGLGVTEQVYQPGESLERIVILPVEGLIVEETYNFVRQAMRKLRDDPPAAIVLRVDSPGGGVGASDRTLDAIKRFRSEMRAQDDMDVPLIASFGSYAASGGYYVAMDADRIIAEPTTSTGSIGVIAQAFTLEQLMDKVGVTAEIITSSDSTRKDMLNTFRAWEDDDRAKLRQILDNNYEQFVDVVDAGRADLTRDEVRALATGEVFTVDAAQEHELIDDVGYLADAIDAAAAAADIDVEPQVTIMRPPGGMGLLGLLLGRAPTTAGTEVPMSVAELANDAELTDLSPKRVRDWLHEASTPRMMYLAPFAVQSE